MAARSVPADTENRAASADVALPPGTRLDEFELLQVLGVGGFGIVYLALDHALLRKVAIKEYMPSALAQRGVDACVMLRSPSQAKTFATGRRSFINEAQLLASFDHPSLVKVYRYWEANDTAYMAMPFYPGRTLKEERRLMDGPPDEAWLRGFVEPILGALEVLHAQGVYHRDIAPDNILLLPDGRPVLLDFGAARRVIGERTRALTAVFKPSFAAIEQYAEAPGMTQGPWSDLYALGAVVHFMLTATPPVPAAVRAVHDHQRVLSASAEPVAGVSRAFLGAIDWSLGVRPQERPQSAQAMRDALDGVITPPPPAPRPSAEPVPAAPTPVASDTVWPATVVDVTRGSAQDAPAKLTEPGPAASSLPPRQPATKPVPRTLPRQAITALLLTILCAVGLGVWGLGARPEPKVGFTASVAPSPVLASAPPPPVAVAVSSSTDAVPHAATRASADAKPLSKVARAPQAAAVPAPAVPQRAQQAMSPREACGDRNFLSMALCMNRQCRDARFEAHPQCQELRRFEQARREAELRR